MKKIAMKILSTALVGCMSCTDKMDSSLRLFGTMPSIESGFEKGVSACYGTVFNDSLYVAGGCNFPEKPVTEGGTKRYYKSIVKTTVNGQLSTDWEKVGELPENSAYGANICYKDKWIVAGGMNENGSTNRVVCINLSDNCSVEELPPLPCAVDNTTGTAANGKIYVVGGNADGRPSNKVFVLDLENVTIGWQEIVTMPSRGRVQPVCAATCDALFVWGGFSPSDENGDAVAYTDGLRYDFKTNTWTSLDDVTVDNKMITFTGGTASPIDEKVIVVAGGVNKDIFTDAISGRYELVAKSDYMHKDPEWYKFNQYLMIYDVENNLWKSLDKNKTFARAGALLLIQLIDTEDVNMFYVGGELKPGIRTPEIHRYSF